MVHCGSDDSRLKKKVMHKLFAFLAAVLMPIGMAQGGTVTLTFDELASPHPDGYAADGLPWNGVTFAAGSSAIYGASLGPLFVDVTDRVLSSLSSETVSLTFATVTGYLHFNIGLGVGPTLTPGFTVQLYDAADSLLSTSVIDGAPLAAGPAALAEGAFTFGTPTGTPTALVKRAVITVNPDSGLFAMDNLSYNVPEPGALGLIGSGLLLLGLAGARRRRA